MAVRAQIEPAEARRRGGRQEGRRGQGAPRAPDRGFRKAIPQLQGTLAFRTADMFTVPTVVPPKPASLPPGAPTNLMR